MKRKCLAVLMAAVMLAGLSACGNDAAQKSGPGADTQDAAGEQEPGEEKAQDDAPAQSSGDRVRIQYSYWGNADEAATEEAIIAAFMEKYTDIEVEPVYIESSYEDKLQLMIAGNTTPDVMAIGSEHIANFSGALAAIDMDDVDTSGYISETPLKALNYNGTQYGLPKRANTKVVAYNKELFDQAGAAWPGQTYSIEQFISDATAISESGEGIYGSNAPWYGQWIYQFGGRTIDENGKVVFNSKEVVGAIQFCADAVHKYQFAPAPEETEGQNVIEWFMGGLVGVYLDCGPFNLPYFMEITDFEWDFGPAPGNGGGMEVVGVSVSATTEHPEEAALFAEFVSTSREAQEVIGSTTALPVTEDGKAVFLQQYPDKNLQAFFDAAAYETAPATIKGASLVNGVLNSAIYDRTAVGTVADEDIQTVLNEAAAEAQAVLDENN